MKTIAKPEVKVVKMESMDIVTASVQVETPIGVGMVKSKELDYSNKMKY